MNILCISKYASLPKYGTMCRSFYLVREFVRQGSNATLITSDSTHVAVFPKSTKTYNFEQIDNVPVWWVKTKKYVKTASVARMLSWLDFEFKLFRFDLNQIKEPDIVIVSSLSLFTILYGIYLKSKFKAKLVFEVRDIWPLTMTEEGGFSKWHPLVILIGWLEKLGYKKSDLVVGTMPKLDLHVKNILGYNQPFLCSPIGFSEEMLECDGSLFESDTFNIQVPKNKIIVGYTGSIGIANRLEPFIEAIKLLRNDESIFFIIAGDGDLREKFEDNLKNCKNVCFFGRIPQGQIPLLLQKVDLAYLAVHKSKIWNYGQSMNKVVEYMLAGKPVLASYSGYPSMINESNCGTFVDTDDPIVIKKKLEFFLKQSKDELEAIGNNGKRWIVENRSYRNLAALYLERMEGLL